MLKFHFENPNNITIKPIKAVGYENMNPVEIYKQQLQQKFNTNVNERFNSNSNISENFSSNSSTENFVVKSSDNTLFDNLYKEMIRSYTKAVSFYVLNNHMYNHWINNWKILKENIDKKDLRVERLSSNDKDVAYTQNKGELLCFRWKDKQGYVMKDVFVYVVLHELAHQCFPKTFIGHDNPFPEMLAILCVAGFELQLFDLTKIPKEMVNSNGQPITSRTSLRDEILYGIELLKKYNSDVKSQDYYNKLMAVVFEKAK